MVVDAPWYCDILDIEQTREVGCRSSLLHTHLGSVHSGVAAELVIAQASHFGSGETTTSPCISSTALFTLQPSYSHATRESSFPQHGKHSTFSRMLYLYSSARSLLALPRQAQPSFRGASFRGEASTIPHARAWPRESRLTGQRHLPNIQHTLFAVHKLVGCDPLLSFGPRTMPLSAACHKQRSFYFRSRA